MGRTINTNIKQTTMGDYQYDDIVVDSLVRAHPVVMIDTIPGKSYFSAFDNFFVDEKHELPLYISKNWQIGGGGPESADFINYFFNPTSSLYLPSMIVNGILGNVAYDLAKKLYSVLKKKFPKKRFFVIFLSKERKVSYFDFPSETTVEDFNKAIDDIPKVAEKAEPQTIFVRSLRDNEWKLEDKD